MLNKILKYFFIYLFIFCIAILTSNAQELKDTSSSKIIQDSATTTFLMKKSPMGAALRSLALPGWGQLYVESYWKAPVFFAGAVTCTYLIVYFNRKADLELEKIYALDQTSPTYSSSLKSIKLWRGYYIDNRDMSALYLLGVYALSAMDAYVGAHLFDFSVESDVSMFILPNPYGGLSLNFSHRW